jgi:hypothetical protein
MVELVAQIFAVRKESGLQAGDKPLIRIKWQLIPSNGLRIAGYPAEYE